MTRKIFAPTTQPCVTRKRRFEQLQAEKSEDDAKRIRMDIKNQPSNPWFYFSIVCGEAQLAFPGGHMIDIMNLFKQIAHPVGVDDEDYTIERFPVFNIGTLKILHYIMQQSNEKPNPAAINELVKKLNEYLILSDALLDDDMAVELPEKPSKWEGDENLQILERKIGDLEKGLDRQAKDYEDIKDLFTRMAKRQKVKEEEPAKKRRRSSSL